MKKVLELPAKTEGDIITYYAGAKSPENSRALLSNGGRVYILSPLLIPSKKPKKPSTRNFTKQIQKASFYRTDIGSKAIKD